MCWTTDAPSTGRLRRRSGGIDPKGGVLGVDMETSAVFCLGIYRNIRVGSVMVVTDEFSDSSWQGGFSSEKVGATMRMVCKTIVKQVGRLGNL